MLITIDPYYDNNFYKECIEALKNNNIEYKEYISIKAPYLWYIELDQKPIMVNYDEISKSMTRFLVNRTKPLRPNEEYLLTRRIEDSGSNGFMRYVLNDAFSDIKNSDYSCFFSIRNREQLENITKDFPGKIWYLGKYYNNKYRVCLCNNNYIKNYINQEDILLENKGEFKEPGRFEAEFNYRVLREKERLVKFTETPYFQNGKYIQPGIKGDKSGKYNI